MVWAWANYPVSISCPGTPPQCPGLFPSPPYIPDVTLSRDQSSVFTDHPVQSSVMCQNHCMRAQLDPGTPISFGRANVLLCCFCWPKYQATVSALPICHCVFLDRQIGLVQVTPLLFRVWFPKHSPIWAGCYQLPTCLRPSVRPSPSPVIHVVFSKTQAGLDPCLLFTLSF